MEQLSEAFVCKKEFSVYVILTLSLKFLPFLSDDALHSKPFFPKLRTCDIETASNNYKIFIQVYVFASCVNFKRRKTTLPTL